MINYLKAVNENIIVCWAMMSVNSVQIIICVYFVRSTCSYFVFIIMKFRLRLIYLTLKLIFYLSTEVNGEDHIKKYIKKSRQKLQKMALLRPTTSEITLAISDSIVSRDIQVEILQPFFYVGEYQASFIQQLNEYKTLSSEPIKLSSDEIATLTWNYDGGSKNNRIITQFKFYQKVQEIQCTNYVLLKFILPKVETYLYVIALYVYNMIEMSYRGKFVVNACVWKLHIQLLGLLHNMLNFRTFINERLPEINRTLQKLITTCRKNEYLMKNFVYTLNYYNERHDHHLLPDTFLKMYDQKYQRFFEKDRFKLSIRVEDLLMSYVITCPERLINDIDGLAFNWTNTSSILNTLIENVNNQYEKDEWTEDPFYYIKYQETVLDILKATLYCHIWVHLVFYQQKVASTLPRRTLANMFKEMVGTLWNTSDTKDMFVGTYPFSRRKIHVNNKRLETSWVTEWAGLRFEYDTFIHELHKVLMFAYIEDQLFNEILILLNEIYEPDDEKIDKIIEILANAVNDILRNYNEPYYEYKKAKIDFEHVKLRFKTDSKILNNNRYCFERFFRETEIGLARFNLSHLLFYINGTKIADFVLPKK